MEKQEPLQSCFETIDNLFKKEDWLSLISFSKGAPFESFLKATQKEENIWDINFLANSIRCLTRVGLAFLELEKFKEAQKQLENALKIVRRNDWLINELNKEILKNLNDQKLKDIQNYFKEVTEQIRPIKVELLIALAYSRFKTNEWPFITFIRAAIDYKNALQLLKKEEIDFFIQIKIDLGDVYYEITKQWITLIKLLFFIILLVICPKEPIISTIINISLCLNNILYQFLLAMFIVTLIAFIYKIFYAILRKIGAYFNTYLISILPKNLRTSLKELLNTVNLKRFTSFKYYKNAIEKIEDIGNKNFDTYFAICKLYYCLGEYENATFYAQEALKKAQQTTTFIINKRKTGNSATEEQEHNRKSLVYHYLARIAYKSGNHSMAISFYDKTIEHLINQKNNTEGIHVEPSMSDMVKYAQENRDILDKTTFYRTYLPVIIALIISVIIYIAQIYYNIDGNDTKAKNLFKNCKSCFCQITSQNKASKSK